MIRQFSKPSKPIAGLATALAFSWILPASSPADPPKPTAITEITLEDSPGFVVNPRANKIVLRRDATCWRLTGKSGEPQKLKGFIRPRDFDWLAARFTSAAFFKMKPRYQPNPMMSDMATVTISAVRSNKRFTVHDYSRSGPESLWQLQLLTRGIAETINWQPAEVAPGSTPTTPLERPRL